MSIKTFGILCFYFDLKSSVYLFVLGLSLESHSLRQRALLNGKLFLQIICLWVVWKYLVNDQSFVQKLLIFVKILLGNVVIGISVEIVDLAWIEVIQFPLGNELVQFFDLIGKNLLQFYCRNLLYLPCQNQCWFVLFQSLHLASLSLRNTVKVRAWKRLARYHWFYLRFQFLLISSRCCSNCCLLLRTDTLYLRQVEVLMRRFLLIRWEGG